jgi:hypothetical protein
VDEGVWYKLKHLCRIGIRNGIASGAMGVAVATTLPTPSPPPEFNHYALATIRVRPTPAELAAFVHAALFSSALSTPSPCP